MNEKESILEIGNETHRLKCGLYLIGRNSDNIEHHIPINDNSVDIKHAILEISQKTATLTDLFSKNGTYVNDMCLQKGEYYKLHTTSPSSIKFGNILGNFRFSSTEDSGYHGVNSPSHQENNKSDIIPPSPDRDISQTATRSKLFRLTSKVTSSSSQNENSSRKSLSPSILVPSTQMNRSTEISLQNESIRKNIEWLEEEDDFYIPETQEIFKKDIQRDSREHQRQEKQKNRIFDDTESMMRICTQDFNVFDEKTTDSDDLLRDIVIPMDGGVSAKETKVIEKDDMKERIAEVKEHNLKKNETDKVKEKKKNDNLDDDDNVETDCEDEMSALKWNESSSNKSKSTIINENNSKLPQISNRSSSMTPDLEIANKLSPKKVNEPKSGSTTPDLDIINRLLPSMADNSSSRRSSKDSVHSKSGSATPDFDVIAKQIESEKQNSVKLSTIQKDDANDDDDYLDPTQLFIRKPFTKVIMGQKFENSLKISPSNKENAPKNAIANHEKQNVIDDDGLEATQVFVYDKNQLNAQIGNNTPTKDKIFKDTYVKVTDYNFLKPTIAMATVKRSLTTTTKSTASVDNVGDHDNARKDDIDDDNDMLEPTQIFERPSHIPVVTASKSVSSASVTSNNSNKSTSPTTVLSQFNFDICTPNWDCLKLPTADTIKKAGKIFSEISKNQKHEKCLFEESSSSNSSEDDFEMNTGKPNNKITKSKEKHDKKAKEKKEKPKVNKTVENQPMMTRTRKNEVNTKKEEELKKKLDVVEHIEERRSRRQANRLQKLSENSDNVDTKSVKDKHEKTEKSTRGRKKGKTDEEKLAKVEIRIKRTTRLASKDTDTSSNKSSHKRGSDEISKDDLQIKRKRKNDESSTFQINLQLKKPKIVFTKVDSAKYKTELKKIGAKIVNNPQDCTILVAEQVFWTWKLMAAMAKGVPIVSPTWIEDAAKTPDNLPSVENYIIKDQQSERRFKFNLKKSLIAARQNPIFEGYSFLITPKTKPPPEELIRIIDCGKGKVLRKAPVHDVSNFYVISDKDDMLMWHKVRKSCPNVQIINTEGIMMAALQQRINFKNYLLS